MQLKKICEFQKGEKIEGFFLIKNLSCKITNGNNNKFLDIDLMDKTGDINAKLWECSEDTQDRFKPNMLVKVRGNVLEWKGKLQLKIELIREVTEQDNVDVTDFVPVAPYDPQEMYDEIKNYINKINNKDIKNMVNEIMKDVDEELIYYPAAKSNHHSVRSGLLYHTLTMLRAAEKLMDIYDFLNSDLIFAGVILHDMAKIEEMISSDLGIVSEYSTEGQLLGHIVIGVRKIEVAAAKVNADKEISMLLQHMVLSHHYEAEYGSPKKPMIPEAEMLHHLDIMDARMYDMKKAVQETNKGEFSDKIWSLDGIRVYNTNFDK